MKRVHTHENICSRIFLLTTRFLTHVQNKTIMMVQREETPKLFNVGGVVLYSH